MRDGIISAADNHRRRRCREAVRERLLPGEPQHPENRQDAQSEHETDIVRRPPRMGKHSPRQQCVARHDKQGDGARLRKHHTDLSAVA